MTTKYLLGERVLWRDRQNYMVAATVLRVRMEAGGPIYELDVNGMSVLAAEEDLRRGNGR